MSGRDAWGGVEPPPADQSWLQTEPVRGARPTPPRSGGGWRAHSRWVFPLIALAAGLTAGLTIGNAGTGTPKACGDALTKAEQVMTYDDQAFNDAAAALDAAGTFDTDTITQETARIRALTPLKQASAAAYTTAAQACRDAS